MKNVRDITATMIALAHIPSEMDPARPTFQRKKPKAPNPKKRAKVKAARKQRRMKR